MFAVTLMITVAKVRRKHGGALGNYSIGSYEKGIPMPECLCIKGECEIKKKWRNPIFLF